MVSLSLISAISLYSRYVSTGVYSLAGMMSTWPHNLVVDVFKFCDPNFQIFFHTVESWIFKLLFESQKWWCPSWHVLIHQMLPSQMTVVFGIIFCLEDIKKIKCNQVILKESNIQMLPHLSARVLKLCYCLLLYFWVLDHILLLLAHYQHWSTTYGNSSIFLQQEHFGPTFLVLSCTRTLNKLNHFLFCCHLTELNNKLGILYSHIPSVIFFNPRFQVWHF